MKTGNTAVEKQIFAKAGVNKLIEKTDLRYGDVKRIME